MSKLQLHWVNGYVIAGVKGRWTITRDGKFQREAESLRAAKLWCAQFVRGDK